MAEILNGTVYEAPEVIGFQKDGRSITFGSLHPGPTIITYYKMRGIVSGSTVRWVRPTTPDPEGVTGVVIETKWTK